MSLKSLIPALCCLAMIATVAAQEGLDWKPKQGKHAAEVIGPIEYLPHERSWERLTVWTPKNAPADERLPCIIHVYGGGYKKKGCPADPGQAWLERGFVVAQPDYMLFADNPALAAGWDIMHAVRYLRANAERFRIDPERIGIIGFSAGGWIVQNHCYADDSTAMTARLSSGSGKKRGSAGSVLAPVVLSDRALADVPSRVQAAVSDWGASILGIKQGKGKNAVERLGDLGHVTADDPPLMTCFKGGPRELTGGSIAALTRVGVPAEPVFLLDVKSTHVPKGSSPGKLADGGDTTWYDAVGDYFERHVKNPTQATAPELHPHGGPIAGPTEVQVLSVHGPGSVRYTLDGSDPTLQAEVAAGTITVQPGQTLRAIAVKEGLKPSRVATAAFVKGQAAPVITTQERSFTLEPGKAFSLTLGAEAAGPVVWALVGQTEIHVGPGWKDYEPWISVDPKTGKLSAPDPKPGTFTIGVIVGSPIGRKGEQPPFPSTAIQLHFTVGAAKP